MGRTGFSPKRKDQIKVIRTIIQAIILLILLIIILKALFSFSVYKPYDNSVEISNTQDTGFVAVSYFGVDRTGDDTLVSTKNLNDQLKALRDNGYVTITQKDIMDYYKYGKKLPEKSLFLMFEDGRNDTAIFSQKIMEEYNFKGSMLTYADKFAKKEDTKFLKPKDLKDLVKSSYWELGSNGYRLEYINVFDKDENYLGNMTSVEFSKVSDKLGRDYNHYLMDYIRDKDDIPLESYNEMKKRIENDYNLMSEIYTNDLGKIPELYALMHSNTGQFATNNRASKINEKHIKQLFKMNFNREGYSFNAQESSVYDLTRIQPQSYWPTNHLLMRIYDDTKQEMKFVTGDEKKAESFKEVLGKAEFYEDTIILTSYPRGDGLLKLLNSEQYKNISLSTTLNGNIIGAQRIYLRSNEDQRNSIYVEIANNILNVIEVIDGKEKELYSSKLDDREDFDIKDRGSRKLEIFLDNDDISVYIDKKCLVDKIKLSNVNSGNIYLESSWKEYGYSQRNLADDVYDGIFKKLKIEDTDKNILYDNTLNGIETFFLKTKKVFNTTINYFIKYL